MNETVDTLTVAVRSDTTAFANDVNNMRSQLDGPFSKSVDAAGKKIEDSLAQAIVKGKLNFADLEKTALSSLANIASSAIKLGLESLLSGGRGGSGGGNSSGGDAGLVSSFSSLISSFFGAPGRATGGPVSPGQAYRVGENGPELFVPTTAGSIAANGGGGQSGSRDVRVTINVNTPPSTVPDTLARSSRQVARAVRNSLMQAN